MGSHIFKALSGIPQQEISMASVSRIYSQPIALTGTHGNKTAGEVTIQEWDPKGRTKRALKTLGIFWGLAIAAVFLPLVHFVLVPLLVLTGPFVAAFVYTRETMIISGTGTCPNCQKPFAITKNPLKWPLNDVCGECHNSVEINLA
jgi:hypothetical protein